MEPKFDTCFFERYAQCSLQKLLGERYADLENYDRPDLQDAMRSIGVEVTRAMREDKQAAQAMVNEMADRAIFPINAMTDEVRTYGYAYGVAMEHGVGDCEYEYWLMALPLKRILESKVRKVMDGFYGHYNEFGLYVFTRHALPISELEDAMHYVMALQQGADVGYDYLYISEINKMHVCDLRLGSYRTYAISAEMCSRFYRNAVRGKQPQGCL